MPECVINGEYFVERLAVVLVTAWSALGRYLIKEGKVCIPPSQSTTAKYRDMK